MSTHRASIVLGAAGVLLAAQACSDAVPPASEGAYTAKFVDTGVDCTIKTHDAKVGDATQTNYGLLKDGAPSVDVTCIVIDEGGSFYAEGKISANDGNDVLGFTIPSISKGASIDEPAHGTITFRSAESLAEYASPSSTPCTFWFEAGSQQQIEAGRLWVNFDCEAVVSGTSTCRLRGNTPNALAVQNCDQ